MFYDNDWVRFFIRVTSPGQELINAEKKAMINNNSVLLDLLEFILFRNPNMRPTINDVINRFQMVKSVLVSGVKKTHATYVAHFLNPRTETNLFYSLSLSLFRLASALMERMDMKGRRSKTFVKQLYDSLSDHNNGAQQLLPWH